MKHEAFDPYQAIADQRQMIRELEAALGKVCAWEDHLTRHGMTPGVLVDMQRAKPTLTKAKGYLA